MADEVRVSSQGPDGNGVQVDLREKKFALTGPNVALLMLILIIGGVAYLRTGTIDKTLKAVQEQVAATEGRVHERVTALFTRMDKLIDDLQRQNDLLNANNAKVTAGQVALQTTITDSLNKQNELLHSQTQAIADLVSKQTAYIETWFSEMGKRFEVLNHNIAHPDRALPLRSPLPPESPSPSLRDR